MTPPIDIFTALAARRAAGIEATQGLLIKAGTGFDAAILKLLRPGWTSDPADQFVNSNGLFFSIWVDAACVKLERARYNLHARKLSLITGKDFAAREFARIFRGRSTSLLEGWPNLSYPKGPITLFEGHFRLDNDTLDARSSDMIDRFLTLVPLLDAMLAPPPQV